MHWIVSILIEITEPFGKSQYLHLNLRMMRMFYLTLGKSKTLSCKSAIPQTLSAKFGPIHEKVKRHTLQRACLFSQKGEWLPSYFFSGEEGVVSFVPGALNVRTLIFAATNLPPSFMYLTVT
jgi:hypothetical protein